MHWFEFFDTFAVWLKNVPLQSAVSPFKLQESESVNLWGATVCFNFAIFIFWFKCSDLNGFIKEENKWGMLLIPLHHFGFMTDRLRVSWLELREWRTGSLSVVLILVERPLEDKSAYFAISPWKSWATYSKWKHLLNFCGVQVTDMHGHQRMTQTDFTDALTFHLE